MPPCPSPATQEPFDDVWEIFGEDSNQCRSCHTPGGHGPVDCFVARRRMQAHVAMCRYRYVAPDDQVTVAPFEESMLYRVIFEDARYNCPETTVIHTDFYWQDPDFDDVIRDWYAAATGQD